MAVQLLNRRRSVRLPRSLFIGIAILAGQLIGTPTGAQDPLFLQNSARSHVIVLAHRACWGPAPEVSVAAINHCLVVGADMVEIDVRRTRDGALILMHDESVDRTTDGTGLVSELTLAQIKSLHLKTAGGGPQSVITAERVPTLEEGLAAAKGKLLVNLHLKVPAEADVANAVRRMGMVGQVTTWVTLAANDSKLLNSPLRGAIGIIPTINECGPQYPQPCFTRPIRSLEAYGRVQAPAFFLDYRQSRDFIRSVAEAKRPSGARIFVETLNNVDTLPREQRHDVWRDLVDKGVSIIMTNEPRDLAAFLKTIPFRARPADARPRLAPIRASGAGARPIVIAHRGGAALMPENTFPAFDNAIRLGADWLEFDMVMTADDQLVIQHDPTVNGSFCTAPASSDVKPAPIRLLTLEQVLKFDCGSHHREIYPKQKAVPGTPMPTPAAFFERYQNADVTYFGEAKMPATGEGEVDPIVITTKIAALVSTFGLEDRFVFQSSDWRTIDAMHAINPRIRTCLLYVWRAGKDYVATATAHHASCLLLRLEDANADVVRRLQEAGIMVISDVVDDEATWRKYLERGDDAMFTNDPAAFLSFARKSGIPLPPRGEPAGRSVAR